MRVETWAGRRSWPCLRRTAMRAVLALICCAGPMANAEAQNYQNGSRNSQQNDNSGGDNANRRSESQGIPTIDPSGGAQPIQPVTIGSSNRIVVDSSELPTDRGGNATVFNLAAARAAPAPATPGEFETYVERAVGRRLPRFGANLLLPASRDFAIPASATVPPGYVLNVGDIVSVQLQGSIEGDVERQIDPDGNIFLPRVGSIHVAGVRYADLRQRIQAAVGRQFRNFQVSISVRQLRGVRVYVTGFANNPGAYTVNSLSTLVNAVLAAGGPSSGGSFRSVKLYRGGRQVSDFDIYDLLRRGDRSRDAVLQNEDVLFIPPVGDQVAVVGSVNEEAIYELKPGETLANVIGVAGGANNLADRSRVILYRLSALDTVGGQQIAAAAMTSARAQGGDIVQVLSQGTLQHPIERQAVLVRIEGEVGKPGNYFVPPDTPLGEVMARAGGLTRRAYAFGTQLIRQSVRAQQRASFLEAVDQLEVSLAAAPLTSSGIANADERAAQLASARAVLDRLRRAEPDGRVVLSLPPEASALPANVILENNDRIVVPLRATTVGVFGAVYRPASFLIEDGRTLRIEDYVTRAGGPLRAGDRGQIFVVHANGEVLPKHRGALKARALPGDVVFVPVRTSSNSLFAKIRDFAAVVFQFGLSAFAVSAISR